MAFSTKFQAFKQELLSIDIRVCLVVMLFGTQMWIGYSGLLLELPVLVLTQPEAWTLPSYFNIIIGLGIIGPLAYSLLSHIFPGSKLQREVYVGYFILMASILALVLMAFFWSYTTVVAGAEHSVALLLILWCLCLLYSLGNVVFYPFMVRFDKQYMPVFMAGKGMGSLFNGFLALAQKSGSYNCENVTEVIVNETTGRQYMLQYMEMTMQDLAFSVTDFLFIVSAVSALSSFCYMLLNHAPFCKKEYSSQEHNTEAKHLLDDATLSKSTESTMNTKVEAPDAVDKGNLHESNGTMGAVWRVRFSLFVVFLGEIIVYGLESSVRPFACIPYGLKVYSLGCKLKAIISPLASLAALFFKNASLGVASSMMFSSIALTCLMIVLATLSPSPPLKDTTIGPVLVVLILVSLGFLFNCSQAMIAYQVSKEGDSQSMRWMGMCITVGNAVGKTTSFLLVTVLNLFVQIPPCAQI